MIFLITKKNETLTRVAKYYLPSNTQFFFVHLNILYEWENAAYYKKIKIKIFARMTTVNVVIKIGKFK